MPLTIARVRVVPGWRTKFVVLGPTPSRPPRDALCGAPRARACARSSCRRGTSEHALLHDHVACASARPSPSKGREPGARGMSGSSTIVTEALATCGALAADEVARFAPDRAAHRCSRRACRGSSARRPDRRRPAPRTWRTLRAPSLRERAARRLCADRLGRRARRGSASRSSSSRGASCRLRRRRPATTISDAYEPRYAPRNPLESTSARAARGAPERRALAVGDARVERRARPLGLACATRWPRRRRSRRPSGRRDRGRVRRRPQAARVGGAGERIFLRELDELERVRDEARDARVGRDRSSTWSRRACPS